MRLPPQVAAAGLALMLGSCALQTAGLSSDGGSESGSATDGRVMDAVLLDSSVDARRDSGVDASLDGGPADAPIDTGTMDAPPSGHITIRRECEDGTLVGAMTTGSDAVAFGGAYADTPGGVAPFSWDRTMPLLPPARTELAVDLPRGGTWYLWIRMYAQDGSSDAMHMGFDAADIRRVYPPRTRAWAWMHATHDGDDDLRFDGLSPGARTLVVGVGEPTARCDRVILTTDSAFVATEAP